jgi:hypothetical protein
MRPAQGMMGHSTRGCSQSSCGLWHLSVFFSKQRVNDLLEINMVRFGDLDTP